MAGKVKAVHRTVGSPRKELTFGYGASGQRIMKQVAHPDLDAEGYREHYIRDAQGNIMATYRYTNQGAVGFALTDRPLYGSSRLGSYTKDEALYNAPQAANQAAMQQLHLHYELTDHLGNVTAVVTGRLLPDLGTGNNHQADLLSAQGYEPFGSLLPGRNYSSDAYRFGFNGMPKDDEISDGTGSSYTAEFWQYDPRTARRWNLDPVSQVDWSNYSCLSDNPIFRVDPNGDHDYTINKRGKIKLLKETESESHTIFNHNASSSISVSKAFMATLQQNTFGAGKALHESTFASGSNTDEVKSAYEFFSSNTDVEWELNVFRNGKREFATLASSHTDDKVQLWALLGYRILDRNPQVRLTYTSHSHPMKYDEKTGHPAYPSGFLPNLTINRFEKGDRDYYKWMHGEYGERVPSMFNIYVSNRPIIGIEYTDSIVFKFTVLQEANIIGRRK